MKRFFVTGGVALLSLMATAIAADLPKQEAVPGEFIVKYRDDMPRLQGDMRDLYERVGVSKVRRLKGLMAGFEHVILKSGTAEKDALHELALNPMVEYVEPNYIYRVQPVAKRLPDGTMGNGFPCWVGRPKWWSKKAWLYLPRGCDPTLKPIIGKPEKPNPPDDGTDIPSPDNRPAIKKAPKETIPAVADPDLGKTYGINQVQAKEAWKLIRGSKTVIVAVIDTGTDYNHQDLAFNIWRNPNPEKKDYIGYDFVHGDGFPFDDNGHGTHTAGTVGATGGNGIGISGVAQQVSIMPVKFLSGQGSGTLADAVKAIDYAVEHGAKILSNSWGSVGANGSQAVRDAILRAEKKGVLFVVAAGNGYQGYGQDNDSSNYRSWPASENTENMIAVAAVDEQGGLARFSNYGKNSVHVAAPGVNVYSALPNNQYKEYSGTSMACPHVAGVAAMVWAANPKLTYKQVKKVIMDTVDPLQSVSGRTVTGGRVNAFKAVQMAQQMQEPKALP